MDAPSGWMPPLVGCPLWLDAPSGWMPGAVAPSAPLSARHGPFTVSSFATTFIELMLNVLSSELLHYQSVFLLYNYSLAAGKEFVIAYYDYFESEQSQIVL